MSGENFGMLHYDNRTRERDMTHSESHPFFLPEANRNYANQEEFVSGLCETEVSH